MSKTTVLGLLLSVLASSACGGQGAGTTAPAHQNQAPSYVPAALAHVRIPRAPAFAVPRAPDAVLRASRSTDTSGHYPFFAGETALDNGVYYLSFSNGNYFGYYSYLSNSRYIYHFDAGYEYTYDAADGNSGIYLYDFASQHFWYTSPVFPFPYIYDFSLNSVLYYYPDPNNSGHYNSNGTRYFYEFATGQIITM